MNNKASITSFGSEVIRFKRELNEDGAFVKDLMLDLITNMLYWNSFWSPAKSSEVVMIEDWNITYPEFNALANDIFRIHTSLENMFRDMDDRRWGIYAIDVILDNGDYFDVAIRKMGDYRIEQWNNDHGKELCPNGALRESISGNRWHESGRSNIIVRARQRHRPK